MALYLRNGDWFGEVYERDGSYYRMLYDTKNMNVAEFDVEAASVIFNNDADAGHYVIRHRSPSFFDGPWFWPVIIGGYGIACLLIGFCLFYVYNHV